jgi:hypothetical protein
LKGRPRRARSAETTSCAHVGPVRRARRDSDLRQPNAFNAAEQTQARDDDHAQRRPCATTTRDAIRINAEAVVASSTSVDLLRDFAGVVVD